MSKKKVYDRVIKELMANDRNASFDMILEDCENNLDRAIEELKEILERLTIEDDEDGFYKNLLNDLMEGM